MPDYLFEFTAHIVEDKRPEGFPKKVYIREQYAGIPSDEQVKDLYNSRVKAFITNPGIIVFLNEDETIDTTAISFEQRVFIPWHMISYFHGRVKVVTPPPEPTAMLDNMALPEMPPAKGTIN
jgi:hypothetical protein